MKKIVVVFNFHVINIAFKKKTKNTHEEIGKNYKTIISENMNFHATNKLFHFYLVKNCQKLVCFPYKIFQIDLSLNFS